MTTFYVDFVNGLDTNNGLGPDASNLTNKPFKTITKLLVGSGMGSGDTAYLSPAGPFRETIASGLTPSGTTSIVGDPGNAQGFKTSGGVLVAPGPVIVTAYTTNDKTAPSSTTLLNLNGKSFFSFRNIMFVGGSAIAVTATSLTSHDITFTDCAFLSGSTAGVSLVSATAAHGVALNWTIDRCLLMGSGSAGLLVFTGTLGAVADWDMNVIVRNSVFYGSRAAGCVTVATTGSGSFKPGGVRIRNCSALTTCNGIIAGPTNHSTSIPSTVTNCLIYSPAGVGINAITPGTITEDYNLIYAGATPRTNVSTGAHSISDGSYSPLFHFGQEAIWGMSLRPFGEPMVGAPPLGFGNDGNQTSYDGLNRPKPAGGASASPAVGWLERGNTAAQATSPTPAAGTYVWKGTGPWYQDFYLPVSNAATTIAADEQHDANYTGTKPSLLILAQPELGVSAQTITSTGGSASNNTITSASFTPTASGFIVVRLVSYDTSGISVAAFSNVVIT